MHKKILCWQDADWNIAYNKNNQKPGQTNKWRIIIDILVHNSQQK